MRGALAVRVNDGIADRIVTSKARDLRFRKTAPGGHHSASCRLILPRDAFRDLGPADRLYIYDSRTARTIWEGYTENPGVTDGSGGQEFDLTAMGGMVLASDESRAMVFIDSHLDQWVRDGIITNAPSSRTEVEPRPTDGVSALMCQFPPGQPIAGGSRARMRYPALAEFGLKLGAYAATVTAGLTSADYRTNASTGITGQLSAPDDVTASTASVSRERYAGTDFDATSTWVALQIYRPSAAGATNVATDTAWAAFTGVRVLPQFKNRNGATVIPTRTTHVLASEVVEDILGRVLAATCDPATSTVEATTAAIDQLAYFEGAKALQVFDDLGLYEPDFLWEILETGSNGKHRFNFRAWPTTPRYEISVRDGYSAPGGEVDLCNRIAVYWTDEKGNKRTTTVTQTVAALGSRTRDAEPVTLPEGLGSLANAQRIGAQVLASKANPPKAATAVVKRPILDRLTGMTVMPWEIEPGYLVRVRETGDDLRLTEMEYVDQDCAATLTLGTPVRSLEQMVADLSRSR